MNLSPKRNFTHASDHLELSGFSTSCFFINLFRPVLSLIDIAHSLYSSGLATEAFRNLRGQISESNVAEVLWLIQFRKTESVGSPSANSSDVDMIFNRNQRERTNHRNMPDDRLCLKFNLDWR